MSKHKSPIYSRYNLEALDLLSKYLKIMRVEKKISMQDLAGRAGISRGLLHRIEKGEPTCAIGAVFEVASILGLKIFNSNYNDLRLSNQIANDKLTLLPSEVRKNKIKVDDDF